MNIHDYIIGTLIVIIVAIQFLVALTTSKKITLFKSIVPYVNNFETIKVFIPEDQIKTIKTEDILSNLKKYNGMPPFNIEIQEEIVEEENTNILNILEDIKNNKNDGELVYNDKLDLNSYDETFDFDNSKDENIWVINGTLEEKIQKSQINYYVDMGWSILKDDKYGS